MKISPLALAAVLLLPVSAVADHDDDSGEERVEIRTRVRHGDRDGGRGDGRRGREGAHGRHDPAELEKLEKLRELDQKLRDVSSGLREGTEAEKAAAKTEARKILGEMYDAKLALDAAMLARLEKHVTELKAKVARKKAGREKAIENRLARLAGESDDWD